MPEWNPTELEQIAVAREIEVSALREDGALTKPVTVWAVRVEGELFVRSVRGGAGQWFRAIRARHEGRIEAGDAAVDVAFEDVPHHLDAEIDEAYKLKYGYPSGPVDSITSEDAQATTTRVVPR